MKGNIGFVPSNYVMKLKVEPSFIVGFLESSIESLKLSSENDEINGIIYRDDLIKSLEQRKSHLEYLIEAKENGERNPKIDKKIANGSIKSAAYNDGNLSDDLRNDVRHKLPDEVPSNNNSSHKSKKGDGQPKSESESQKSTLAATKEETTVSSSPLDNSIMSETSEANTATTTTATTSDEITTISKLDTHKSSTKKHEQKTPDQADIQEEKESTVAVEVEAPEVYSILDAIRKNTNLSHEMSCSVLRVVLSELEAILPSSITPYLEPIAAHLAANLPAPDNMLGQTHDAQRLRIIFSELADYKNDSQQRSWMLYEDEADIRRYLSELVTILTDADPKICRHEMSSDQYQAIVNLVQYYQMETRWSIRKLLLKAFTAMSHLDYVAVDILLNSVLPMELIQDMLSNPKNVDLLQSLANMLTIIFSIGRKLPINHQEHLRSEFISFIINLIENPLDMEFQEIMDDLIYLILSFNLQFTDADDNVVIEAMQQLQCAKNFTEKILLLINRESDPVALLKHTQPPINSVVKMFIDMYNLPVTAGLFYTNDNKVLIDIIVRQLSDLPAGEMIRRHYLELARRIIRNTNYSEQQHRKQELLKIFTRIFCEDTEISGGDQQVCREIANEFPHIFKA